jgi:hypothetical protein
MGVSRGTYRCLVKKRERMSQLGDLDVDDRIILKWIFNWDGARSRLIWLRIGTGGGLL